MHHRPDVSVLPSLLHRALPGGDRARQEAVRRRICQRSAELRFADEPGRVPGAVAAGRNFYGSRPQFGWAPDPWFAGQHVGQMVQRGAIWC